MHQAKTARAKEKNRRVRGRRKGGGNLEVSCEVGIPSREQGSLDHGGAIAPHKELVQDVIKSLDEAATHGGMGIFQGQCLRRAMDVSRVLPTWQGGGKGKGGARGVDLT